MGQNNLCCQRERRTAGVKQRCLTLLNSVNDFVREDSSLKKSLEKIVWENVFFKVVQYNPLTGCSGWAGDWRGAMHLMLQYFSSSPRAKLIVTLCTLYSLHARDAKTLVACN